MSSKGTESLHFPSSHLTHMHVFTCFLCNINNKKWQILRQCFCVLSCSSKSIKYENQILRLLIYSQVVRSTDKTIWGLQLVFWSSTGGQSWRLYPPNVRSGTITSRNIRIKIKLQDKQLLSTTSDCFLVERGKSNYSWSWMPSLGWLLKTVERRGETSLLFQHKENLIK